MLTSWSSVLQAREFGGRPRYREDFASLLVEAGAYEVARTFVIGKTPSDSDLGHLLACTVPYLFTDGAHQVIQFARWLIERGADMFVQCGPLREASSVSQSEMEFVQVALRKVPDDTTLQLPVLDDNYYVRRWDHTVEGQDVFCLMNVNASRFRQRLEAAIQAVKQNISVSEEETLM
ncbi:hypothetical protein LTR70_007952 [Exophiala xenobiotica]|nr:hypothetical protein LTR70_007952 [Exophiala xenobiotica]